MQSESSSWRHYLPWGLAWGAMWATVLNLVSGNPGLYRLESDLQQHIMQLRAPQSIAPEVLIVGIDGQVDGSDGQTVDFFLDRKNYAGLALRLIEEAQAKVVVLNLPSSFVIPQTLWNENLDAPLKQVVQQYPNRLVLATRSSESFKRSEISIYNHFLPFSSLRLEYVVPPEEIQGVVQNQVDNVGVLRYAFVRGNFKRRDSQTIQTFPFVEALTLGKYNPELAWNLFNDGTNAFLFSPLNPGQSIPVIPIETLCPPQFLQPCLREVDPSILAQFRDRIVLVGFVDGNPETFAVTTASGSQIAAVELQAQILSSFLQGTFYHELPSWVAAGIVYTLAIGVGGLLVASTSPFKWPWTDWQNQRQSIWAAVVCLTYELFAISQLWIGRWIWPIGTPLLACGLTTLSVLITRVMLQNRDRLHAQQQELEQLKLAEQEAAVDQARKLLYRVATDIHDQELQELKVVMDLIETIQWQHQEGKPVDQSTYDDLIQQLEHIGRGIRDQLNDVRTLATKLNISPSLREGLHAGIASYVNGLNTSGVLTLPVQLELQPLNEIHTSEWVDQREDILRFLREAIANVISHVQPPKGTATYVIVRLKQLNQRCSLEVINDGVKQGPKRQGGYGTKAMNTIAKYLPQGSWSRHQTPTGEIHVELQWTMSDQ